MILSWKRLADGARSKLQELQALTCEGLLLSDNCEKEYFHIPWDPCSSSFEEVPFSRGCRTYLWAVARAVNGGPAAVLVRLDLEFFRGTRQAGVRT